MSFRKISFFIGTPLYIALMNGVLYGQEASRPQVSFLTALRTNTVFRGSDPAKTSNYRALFGEAVGTSVKSSHFFAYGIELDNRWFIDGEAPLYIHAGGRLVPIGFRLTADQSEQFGLDGFVTGTVGSGFQISQKTKGKVEFGIRLRRWFVREGSMPSSGHFGLVLSGGLETDIWNALVEAGLMAAGIANPTTLGLQRDASSFRFRVSRVLPLQETVLLPFIEFFHTHRSFFGSPLVPQETALFLDEASLLVGLGFVL